MSAGTYTWYWAEETETVFVPSTMAVVNENILAFAVKHDEGQIPTLELTIKNPRIGLLNPSRRVWGWFAYYDPSGVLTPLFFGVLVGVPSNLFQEKVVLQFLARSPNYIQNKQAVAETMKIAPYYDPIFLEPAKRDDPDTILEGWSALWHVDRLTQAITASDVLTGEDGTITFTEGQALYSSVSMKLGQAPLSNIRVVGTVNWSQRSYGFFTVPTVYISSYTGETLESDWPKPGASLGGGYKVETSFSTDTYLVAVTPTSSYNSSWNNSDPNPGQCSNASVSYSSSGPALMSPNPLVCVLTSYYQTGVCFPDSDPPQNIPLQSQSTGLIVPLWNFALDMEIRYDANRQYLEQLTIDMTANTQAVITSPTVEQHTELLTVDSVDVSQPLIDLLAWSDFANKAVPIAQMIFPNNPTLPGGLSYQICVTPGVAGSVEPVFSDIPGVTTTDGTVVWASLGTTSLTTAPGWSPASFVPLGEIILLQDKRFDTNTGDFEDNVGVASFLICTHAGQTNQTYSTISWVAPPTQSLEVTPQARLIDYVAQPGQPQGANESATNLTYNFPSTVGEQITDGTVVWTCLGNTPTLLGIPIGGTIDNVTARCFFPTPRGQQSVQYLISRARARLRWRARCVNVSWTGPIEYFTGMSCRKNATLNDSRFPGGVVTGKIVSYSLVGGGDGKMYGTCEIGVSVGYGDSIAEITGTPEYNSDGYMEDDYQVYDGAQVNTGSNDILYTPPVFVPFDDGLQFPLTWGEVSDGGLISGDLASQQAAIEASFEIARQLQWLSTLGGTISTGNTTSSVSGTPPDEAWQITREQIALTAQNTPYVMAANPIVWTCLLKPCTGNGPFSGAYNVVVSPLTVPQGINLAAASNA